jgi:hypothetical protein
MHWDRNVAELLVDLVGVHSIGYLVERFVLAFRVAIGRNGRKRRHVSVLYGFYAPPNARRGLEHPRHCGSVAAWSWNG